MTKKKKVNKKRDHRRSRELKSKKKSRNDVGNVPTYRSGEYLRQSIMSARTQNKVDVIGSRAGPNGLTGPEALAKATLLRRINRGVDGDGQDLALNHHMLSRHTTVDGMSKTLHEIDKAGRIAAIKRKKDKLTKDIVQDPTFPFKVADGEIKKLPNGKDVPYKKVFYGQEEIMNNQLPDLSELTDAKTAYNVYTLIGNRALSRVKTGTLPSMQYMQRNLSTMNPPYRDVQTLKPGVRITRN